MKHHFGIGVGSILLFFGCLTLSVAGLTIITTPTPLPGPLGWLYLAAGVGLAVFTARLWRRVLPGIFACGAFNGVYMASTGHAIGQSKHVSEGVAWGLTVLLLIMAAVNARASKSGRPLDSTDRIAYGLFFVSLTVAFANEWAMTGALLCMLLATGFIILRHRHDPNNGSSISQA
jgi:hypothetical protein